VLRTNEKDANWFGAEDRETRLLEMKKKVSERLAGSAVAICHNCLDALQLAQTLIPAIEVDGRQPRVGCSADAQVVLQK
jgi:hypothetical protein